MFFKRKPLREALPNKKNSPKKDDYKDFVDDSKLDENDDDVSRELEILRIVEIVVKHNQFNLKDIKEDTSILVKSLSVINDLNSKIKQLEAELKEEKLYNRELINKLIDKPSAPSAADKLAALRSANNSNSGGGLGAVEKAAAKK